jgi:hypothetical protein
MSKLPNLSYVVIVGKKPSKINITNHRVRIFVSLPPPTSLLFNDTEISFLCKYAQLSDSKKQAEIYGTWKEHGDCHAVKF